MGLLSQRTIGDFSFELFDYQGETFTVAIYVKGNLWDWKEFEWLGAAEAFMADPFKEERERAIRIADKEAKRIAEQEAFDIAVASLIGCNSGRQVGPNRRGSM